MATIEEDALVIERDGLPIMSLPRPFTPRPSLAVGPDGRIFFARGGDYAVTVHSPTGDTVRVIRRHVDPVPVTKAEADSMMAFIQERYRDVGAAPPPTVELPETQPAIRRIAVDPGGYLWVLGPTASTAAGIEWSVHDPHGRYLGDVSLPAMVVRDIGRDHVAGVTRDELGVQRVVVVPLRRP